MSNDYFDASSVDVPAGSRARSSQVDDVSEAVESAFDLLPDATDVSDGKINWGTDAGVADAYVVTSSKGLSAYSAGCRVAFLAGNANTGAATINVDGLGVKSITQADGNVLGAAEINTANPVVLIYNGATFRLVAGSEKVTKAYIDAAVGAGGDPGDINFQQLGIGVANALEVARINAAGDALEGHDLVISDVGKGTVTAGQSVRLNAAGTAFEGVLSGFKTVSKAAGYTVLLSDNEAWLRCSATLTLALTSAATLGAGFTFLVENTSSAGIITIDPDNTELVDGLTTINVLPNEVRLISCNGSAFTSVVLRSFYQEFSTSGTFTKPLSGYSQIEGIMWGGGGSGGAIVDSVSTYDGGAGGGGGATAVTIALKPSEADTTSAVTIGAGGDAAVRSVDGSTSGAAGGDSAFALLSKIVTAYGGGAGSASSTDSLTKGGGGGGWQGAGSASTPGEPYVSGQVDNAGFGGGYGATDLASSGTSVHGGGGAGSGVSTGQYDDGSDSVYGGAGGGGVDLSATPGTGGDSTFGGNGGDAARGLTTDPVTAEDGVVPGGGGGGAGNLTAIATATSGAGADGLLWIWGVV